MKKIGIVTFNDAYNYGAYLQEYALQKCIESEGYDVDVINYTNSFFSQQYLYAGNILKKRGIIEKGKIIYTFLFRNRIYKERKVQRRKFREAINKDIKHSIPFSYEKKDYFNKNYDSFIAGSDQVWNVRVTNYDKFYFLDFVDKNEKKKSYAASFGRDSFEENDKKIIKENLLGFQNILVREQSGHEMLKEMGYDSDVVLDPTFLLERNQWLEFAKKSDIKLPGKYIVIYLVAEQTNLLDVALKYAKKNNCEVIIFGGKNRDVNFKGKTLKAAIGIGPYDFINYIAHADKVFTTSFHGMAVSINLNVEFYYELCKAKINNNARLISVAKKLNVMQREIIDKELPHGKIQWEKTNRLLKNERELSKRKLREVLEK